MSLPPLQSPDWYRVATLRPRLRAGVRVARQQQRGETWHVLSDPVSGRHHRFNDLAYGIVGSCDGRATLDEIWAARVDAEGEHAPTQAETIRILAQAFAANLLVADVAPDAAALIRSHAKVLRRRRRAQINPLAFRVPLADPDALLTRVAPHLAWLLAPRVQWLLLATIGIGALTLALNAGEFIRHASQGLGEGRMLLAMWLLFPLLKLVHEFAHALAVKLRGGEVHEAGITLMLLTPVPYVDASAANAFEDKRDRTRVALAGIATEALIACAALPLWLLAEPGWLRDVGFAVVFLGVVSTLLVNGNPLLRFDGYYALTDAAELPNLAGRSLRWWRWLTKRHLLAIRHARLDGCARGELPWLIGYAPLSWLYRSVLMFSLAVLAAQWHGMLGLLMLAYALWLALGKPAFDALRWLVAIEESRHARLRTVGVAAAATALATALALLVPLPQRTHSPGVVWLPDDALVRLGTDGVVERLLVDDGAQVRAGTPIAQLADDTLAPRLAQVEADLTRLTVERSRQFEANAPRAAAAEDELRRLGAERDRLQQRIDALTVRAGAAGRVALAAPHRSVGRHLVQGELIAYVLPGQAHLVRALISNDDIDLVRAAPRAIEVHLAHAGATLPATLAAAVPRASMELPTPALGERAGGPIAVDPADAQGRTARQPFFQVDLALDPAQLAAVQPRIGARALVTFDHGSASAAQLATRALRSAFLRHFER